MMDRYRKQWRERIARALRKEWAAAGAAVGSASGSGDLPAELADAERVAVENPPRPELGDLAFPMFPYARVFKTAPKAIAERLARRLGQEAGGDGGRVEAAGAYVNVHLAHRRVIEETIGEVLATADLYGRGESLRERRIVLEFSCPNTNKPLHLGHLRNDALGMSLARILSGQGADVLKVNLINDRGVHICKSMAAYRRFGGGTTPEDCGQKGDHLVGDFYVRFAEWAREDPEAEEEARRMLRSWEEGEPEIRRLWETMNRWAIEGIEQTYRKTGVSFDKVYLESETYLLGRRIVERGLQKGVFYKQPDGSVWVDLSDLELDKKVILRSDGTSLYLTQDLGTAVQRYEDWPFDRMIYVVGNEQRYHFQVLFSVLERLGYDWAKDLYHLPYGMVNLPEGKMKSREGTVVDADDLIADLERLAAEEIRTKGREEEVGDPEGVAGKVALGALNYYLLQPSPLKDMVFDPKGSISFSGNTGPYLQYTGARISSMVRKFTERGARFHSGGLRPELLIQPDEWAIVKQVASFPPVVSQAAAELNPALLTAALFELAQSFSRYYHDNPVLHNEDPDLVVSRMTLARVVRQVLYNGMRLIGVPFLDRM